MNAFSKKISFHDFQPELESFREAVLDGLARKPKQIPPKFFYDKTGSELFEALLEQPEYYIPNIERALLQKHADEFAELIEPGAVLIEPGAAVAKKYNCCWNVFSQPPMYLWIFPVTSFSKLPAIWVSSSHGCLFMQLASILRRK